MKDESLQLLTLNTAENYELWSTNGNKSIAFFFLGYRNYSNFSGLSASTRADTSNNVRAATVPFRLRSRTDNIYKKRKLCVFFYYISLVAPRVL